MSYQKPVSKTGMSEMLQNAFYDASQDVAADMGEGGDDAECVAEACLSVMDMSYMRNAKEVRKELDEILKKHKYVDFIKDAAQFVATR